MVQSFTGKAQLVIGRISASPPRFEATFRRWERGAGTRRFGDEFGAWYRLTPLEPIVNADIERLQSECIPLLECIENGKCDPQFHREVDCAPRRPDKVEEIAHPTFNLTAQVFKHSQSKYEVRYSAEIEGSQETGWRLSPPVSLHDGDPENGVVLTFADTLPNAEVAAIEEMEEIIRSNRQQIRKRFDETG